MTVKNEGLLPLFHEVKELLKPYAQYFTPTIDEPGRYELWSEKNIALEGHAEHKAYFASAIVQKHFVGLYYMPVYTDPELKEVVGPDLLKLLKGKSCFQLKRLDDTLREQIRDALERGYQLYRERGWV